MCIYVYGTFYVHCLMSMRKLKISLLDIHDQNTTCVVASKGTLIVYLNLSLRLHRSVSFIQTMHLKDNMLLDNVTFNIITLKL